MLDTDTYLAELRLAIDSIRRELQETPLDDPCRESLYWELLYCYKERFAILHDRINASIGKPTAKRSIHADTYLLN